MFDSPLELAWNRSVSFFSTNEAFSPALLGKSIHMNGNQKYDSFLNITGGLFQKWTY